MTFAKTGPNQSPIAATVSALAGIAWTAAGVAGCVAVWPQPEDPTGRVGALTLLAAGLGMATICWISAALIGGVDRVRRELRGRAAD